MPATPTCSARRSTGAWARSPSRRREGEAIPPDPPRTDAPPARPGTDGRSRRTPMAETGGLVRSSAASPWRARGRHPAGSGGVGRVWSSDQSMWRALAARARHSAVRIS